MLSTQIYYGILEEFPTGAVQSPFFTNQFPPASRVKSVAGAVLGSSLILLTANLGPFPAQAAVPARSVVRPIPAQVSVSQNLLANPVFGLDLSRSSFPKAKLVDQFSLNQTLLFGSPFTPIDWSKPRAIVASKIPVLIGFQLLQQKPADTHDGVWVKRKKKRTGPDPIELELAEKAKRRAAIELAVYGPEVTYSAPPAALVAPAPPPVDVHDLAMTIANAQAMQHQANRARAEQDDETELEAMLREIL